MHERDSRQNTGSIFLIPIHNSLRAVQRGVTYINHTFTSNLARQARQKGVSSRVLNL